MNYISCGQRCSRKDTLISQGPHGSGCWAGGKQLASTPGPLGASGLDAFLGIVPGLGVLLSRIGGPGRPCLVVAVGYTERKGLSRAWQELAAARGKLVGLVSRTQSGRPSWRKKKVRLISN